MDGKGGGEDWPVEGRFEEADEGRTIIAIAKALREEFSVGIDAHPGGPGSEAGMVNRAFRVVVRSLLARMGDAEGGARRVDRALRLVALTRLEEHGVEGRRAEQLIDSEPGLGERWLAYLGLAPQSVAVDVMHGPRAMEE